MMMVKILPYLFCFSLGIFFAQLFRQLQLVEMIWKRNQAALDATNGTPFLIKKNRILCLVLTTESNHLNKSSTVSHSWGKHCDGLTFLSDKADSKLPAIEASNVSDYRHVWQKVWNGFKWAHDTQLDNFDWFLKADDDTFVVLPNLRSLLGNYEPNGEYYLGREFNFFENRQVYTYNSGGAGYVLSKGALKKLFKQPLVDSECPQPSTGGSEDVFMGLCLKAIGIGTSDTRDSNGRQRFHPFHPYNHVLRWSDGDEWIFQKDKYPFVEGLGCCSDLSIAFHYISPSEMKIYYYLIYKLELAKDSPVYEPMFIQ